MQKGPGINPALSGSSQSHVVKSLLEVLQHRYGAAHLVVDKGGAHRRACDGVGLGIEFKAPHLPPHEAAVQSERLAAIGETVAFLSHHIKNILQAFGGGADVVEAAINRAVAMKDDEEGLKMIAKEIKAFTRDFPMPHF